MYAAKAASGGGPAGQVQGQPGVPPSAQGQYPGGAVAGSPTGVVSSSQHQMPVTSQPQPDMYGVQMNGSGMSAEYQTGSNVGANVQSQVPGLRHVISQAATGYGIDPATGHMPPHGQGQVYHEPHHLHHQARGFNELFDSINVWAGKAGSAKSGEQRKRGQNGKAGSRSNTPSDSLPVSQEDKDEQGGPEFSSLQGLTEMTNADFDSRGNDRSRDEPPSKRTKM